MATWQSSMLTSPPQTEDVNELRMYLKTTINQLAVMMKELDYVLNGQIDVKNVRAKSIEADRLKVDELSAITANMGKLTSGKIYGAYIATQEGAYPRSEMSSTDNLFTAYMDANNYVRVAAEYSGAPSVYFISPNNSMIESITDATSSIDSLKQLYLTSTQDIRLLPGSGYAVRLNSWNDLYFDSQGTSLGSVIGDIYSQIASLDARVTALGG